MNLGINDLSIGYSSNGAEEYQKMIKQYAISDTREALSDYQNVITALRNGWQGQSEANFETNLKNGIDAVSQKLDELDKVLDQFFNNLYELMMNQDKSMVQEDSSIINF